jgi:hypothetical protein
MVRMEVQLVARRPKHLRDKIFSEHPGIADRSFEDI